jgi:Helix-turn-helix of insertion element transposase
VARISRLTQQQMEFARLIVEDNVHQVTKLADMVGIDRTTAWRWKQNPLVLDYMNDLAEKVQDSRTAMVYNELEKVLLDDEISPAVRLKAMELFLKNRGKLKEKKEIDATIETKDASQVASELDALLGE